uniref:Uncharacterized protein n=1 Tax=Pristionchus pacificus TaxID=54126 RepID=A0A2A6CU69_PRIPA|eukprot:PDM81597.1 hypothetical protein PRIPAC_30578 [Pristionchus pacificus]
MKTGLRDKYCYPSLVWCVGAVSRVKVMSNQHGDKVRMILLNREFKLRDPPHPKQCMGEPNG